ncbi:MAG: flagellar hook-basal body complex protein FliE [Opitutales bacterium]
MSAIGPISSALTSQALGPLGGLQPSLRLNAPLPDGVRTAAPGGADGFGQMLDGLVATVNAKETQASDLTKRVLLGDTDQLHQSVIAMQEVSVAFGLMVEVRNKLVDSYQELMRMQV